MAKTQRADETQTVRFITNSFFKNKFAKYNIIFANVITSIPAIFLSKSLCNMSVENTLTNMTIARQ
jgi:hypothetical protein